MYLLKDYIKSILKEDWNKHDKYTLGSGASTDFGSHAHLAELQALLTRLIKLRNAQGRSSATRFAYASAISKLKDQIKKIEKKLEKNNVWRK